ncbi:MAG TPA: glucose-6-phosphate isomerase, partial [Allosphingosinicella sp.]|nr:glucose-6-phosphate isomerase [Allosphingosinicella sp.]
MEDSWSSVEGAERRRLLDLFNAEPDRLSRLVVEEAGIRFDFAKTHLSGDLISGFTGVAQAKDLAG